jgi:hypothetical protein
MTRMTHRRILLGMVWLALAAGVGRADGVDPCRSEAREGLRACKRDCREAFRVAKDACSKRDHECVDECRAGHDACRAPFEAELDGAVTLCDEALRAAKRACREQFPDGSAERDRCIDQAQGVAFACRDAARETVAADFRDCRAAFKGCVETTCPPEAPVDPATFRACRLDARDVSRRCAATCREEFQLAKDTCLDRDHECVEACRAARGECRAPLVAAFEEALGVCAADRAAAIDVCRSLYAADTPERDACVDQAQLAAFACRDAAREAVKPGLRVCREAFLDCAVACPPPGGSPSGAFVR